MNKLYAAWLRREALEQYGKEPCQLTAAERETIEGKESAE